MKSHIIIFILIFCIPSMLLPLTISVKDFGAVGDGKTNDYEAFKATMLVAQTSGEVSVTVVLEQNAIYRLGGDITHWFYFEFTDKKNLTIEGNGATLVSTPTNHIFSFLRCENVEVRNLNIEYNPLPFTQGVIENINQSSGCFDINILPGFPRDILDYHYLKQGDDHFQGWSHCIFLNADGKTRNEKTSVNHMYISRAEALAEGKFRIYADAAYLKVISGIESGNIAVIGLGFNIDGNFTSVVNARDEAAGGSFDSKNACVYARNCRNLFLRDVNIFAAVGRAYGFADNYANIGLFNCGIRPKPGSNQAVSTVIDGIHAKNNGGPFTLEGCHIEGTMDDLVNLSAMEDYVNEVDARNLKLKNTGNAMTSYTLDTGNDLLFFKKYKGEILGYAKVTATTNTQRNTNLVTIDKDIEGIIPVAGKSDSDAVFCMNYGRSSSGYVIRNCTFISLLRRAIAVCWSEGLIENNFLDCRGGGSIWLQNISTNFEGPFPRNVVVKNNIIQNSFQTSILIGANWGVKTPSQFDANIIVKDNIIVNQLQSQSPIQVNNLKNIQIYDNKVYAPNQAVGVTAVKTFNSSLSVESNNQVIYDQYSNVGSVIESKPIRWINDSSELYVSDVGKGNLSLYTTGGELVFFRNIIVPGIFNFYRFPIGQYIAKWECDDKYTSIKILKNK